MTELGAFRSLYSLSDRTLGTRVPLDPTIGTFDAIAVAAVADDRFAVLSESCDPSAMSGRIFEVRDPKDRRGSTAHTRVAFTDGTVDTNFPPWTARSATCYGRDNTLGCAL